MGIGPLSTTPLPPGTIVHHADTRLLFVTRMTRMFAYGFLSVILALYLAGLGLSGDRIGKFNP